MKPCPKCNFILFDYAQRCSNCGQKDPHNIYSGNKKIPSITKKLPQYGKSGAWVDRSTPTPDGIVIVDKRGVRYRVQSGRKRTGEWRNCIDCGKPIFVRSHRKGPTQGKRCAPCNRKVYLPPRKTTSLEPSPGTERIVQEVR